MLEAAESLHRYNIDITSTTVSGLSSGAFMAQQFHFAESHRTRIIHETRGRRSRIPEKQGLMGLVKSGARALFSRQGSVLASSIDRKVAQSQGLSQYALF